MTTVAILDNHRAFGERLQMYVRDQLGCAVVGIADDAATGVELVRRSKPDFALVEVALPGNRGVGLTRELRELHPTLDVVLMGDLDSGEYAPAATQAGARGYLSKTSVGEQLPALLGKTVSDDVYLFEDYLAELADAIPSNRALPPKLRRGLVLEGALAGGVFAGGLALQEPAAALAGATGIFILSRWQSARVRHQRDPSDMRLPWRGRRGR